MNTVNALSRDDLWSLEEYAQKRPEFRKEIMAHKKTRNVAIGPDAVLYFENRKTLIYQIQEMLRIEKVFEAEGIQEELDVYNPMLPTGKNLKATFMIEYSDPDYRAKQLAKMLGIEDVVWIQVEGHDKVWAIADEDLDRANDTKTSSVHFMRFEFNDAMIEDLKAGKSLTMGIDHKEYQHSVTVEEPIKESLTADFS